MPLIIVRAYDPIVVEQIVVAIYGGPGLGKSTLAFTAEDPLSLDCDGGAYRAKNRKDIVRVGKWSDIANMRAADFTGYKTAILDTAGRALDKLSDAIIADNPKLATPAGGLTLQGYGELKSTFTQWLNRLKGFGLDVVLVCHSSEERKGEDIIERLDVQGGSRGEIHKSADAMGRLYVFNGVRFLNFSPTDAAYGKNPGNLDPLEFVNPDRDPVFLANVIKTIKGVLNSQSEAVRAMRAKIEAAREVYSKLETPEAFTAQAEELVKLNADRALKALLVQVAGEKGFTYDRERKGFIAPVKVPEPPADTPLVPTDTPATPATEDPSRNGGPPQEQQDPPPAARKRAAGGGRARRTA